MQIHFKFARFVLRYNTWVDIAPCRAPCGKFTEIAAELNYFKPEFFKEITPYRSSYIPDYSFNTSALFQDRGRLEEIDEINHFSYRMGLMRDELTGFKTGFPTEAVPWVPDAKGQIPDLYSKYVLYLINNDTVYVSGPSGMTSLLLGQMEILANLDTIEKKQCYLAAIAAYIVAGGYHSLHEVLAPAEFVLDLVPGYVVAVADELSQALPPNYYCYYAQQMAIDHEYAEKYAMGWSNYMIFFINHYLPSAPHLQQLAKQLANLTLPQKAIKGIEQYQSVDRRFSGLLSILNFDKDRGEIRSAAYQKILKSLTSEYEKLVIIYSLLSSPDGQILQSNVAAALGFDNIPAAKSAIEAQLKEGYLARSGDWPDYKAELEEKVIKEIINKANNKKRFENGDFKKELDELAELCSFAKLDKAEGHFVKKK